MPPGPPSESSALGPSPHAVGSAEEGPSGTMRIGRVTPDARSATGSVD